MNKSDKSDKSDKLDKLDKLDKSHKSHKPHKSTKLDKSNGDCIIEMAADNNNRRMKLKNQMAIVSKISNINAWTLEISQNLQNYAIKCLGSWWMYTLDASYYDSVNSNINLSIGVLSCVSSIAMGISIPMSGISENASSIAYYVLSIFALVSTVTVTSIQGYQMAEKVDLKAAYNKEKAAKYGELYRKIINQFYLEASDRKNAISFLEMVNERYNELEREKPFIRDSTQEKWKEHLNDVYNMHQGNINRLVSLPKEFTKDTDVYETDIDPAARFDANILKPNLIHNLGQFV